MQLKRIQHQWLIAVLAQGHRLINQQQSGESANPITARTGAPPLRVRTDLHAG